MGRVVLIAVHEYLTNIRRPAYLFIAFVFPLMMMGFNMITLVSARDDDESVQQRTEAELRRNQRAVVSVPCVVASEELRVQTETLFGNVQRRKVERFQLPLVKR